MAERNLGYVLLLNLQERHDCHTVPNQPLPVAFLHGPGERGHGRRAPHAYFTTVALTSSPQGPVSPRVEAQRAW